MKASSRIARILAVFSGVKVVIIVCSLIRNKFIAMLLGPTGIGLVGLYNNLMDLIAQTSRLSMDQSAQRDLSQSSLANTDVTITVVRRWALWLGIGGTVLTCALSPFLSIISFDGDISHWPTFCLLSVLPFCYTFFCCVNAENQGLRRFRTVALSTLLGNVISLLVAIPVIYFLRLNSIAWVITIYAVIMAVVTYFFRPHINKVIMSGHEIISRGKSFIKTGAQITLAMAVTYASNSLFTLFINWYSSTGTLGIYQAGFQIMNSYVGIIFAVLWMEYYPRLSANAHSSRRLSLFASHQARLILSILTPMLCLLIMFCGLAVRLIYSTEFLAITPYIALACVGVVFKTNSYCMAYVILARGDGRTYMFTEISSCIFGLTANTLGFVLGGFVGLGIAYIVWYGFYTLLVTFICHRRYGVKYTGGTWLLTGAAFGLTIIIAAIRLLIPSFL